MTRWLAKVCRSPCVVIRFASFATEQALGTTSFSMEWVRCCPRSSQKTYGPLSARSP